MKSDNDKKRAELIVFSFSQQKHSPWEGGSRSAGLIWSPYLKSANRVSNDLIYSADWLPTLAQIAGLRISPQNRLDGVNQWETISRGSPSLRFEVLHNVNPVIPYTSYRLGNWKYVNGTVSPAQDVWLGDLPKDDNPNAHMYLSALYSSPAWMTLSKHRGRELEPSKVLRLRQEAQVSCAKLPLSPEASSCEPKKAPCIFDVSLDPCERYNLAKTAPGMVNLMERYLKTAARNMVAPRNQPLDPRSDPGLNGGQWTYWMDLLDEELAKSGAETSF